MMSELKTRVEELKMENEYQLRLKDMNYGEKIKDLTDKFLQEIEALKAKNEVSISGQVYVPTSTAPVSLKFKAFPPQKFTLQFAFSDKTSK